MKRPLIITSLVAVGLIATGMAVLTTARLGKQPDGSYFVSTGQRIEGEERSRSPGRPIDLALHPTEAIVAILNKSQILLADAKGVVADSQVPLGRQRGLPGLGLVA